MTAPAHVLIIDTPDGPYRDWIGRQLRDQLEGYHVVALDLASGPDWSTVQPWPPTSAPVEVAKTLTMEDWARIAAAALKRQRRADKRRRIAQRQGARHA